MPPGDSFMPAFLRLLHRVPPDSLAHMHLSRPWLPDSPDCAYAKKNRERLEAQLADRVVADCECRDRITLSDLGSTLEVASRLLDLDACRLRDGHYALDRTLRDQLVELFLAQESALSLELYDRALLDSSQEPAGASLVVGRGDHVRVDIERDLLAEFARSSGVRTPLWIADNEHVDVARRRSRLILVPGRTGAVDQGG